MYMHTGMTTAGGAEVVTTVARTRPWDNTASTSGYGSGAGYSSYGLGGYGSGGAYGSSYGGGGGYVAGSILIDA